MITGFQNKESYLMVVPQSKAGLLDMFPGIASSVQSTSSHNIKLSTKGTYAQHVIKKFGWLTFKQQFNEKFNQNVPDLPTEESYEAYTELLILYFECRLQVYIDGVQNYICY